MATQASREGMPLPQRNPAMTKAVHQPGVRSDLLVPGASGEAAVIVAPASRPDDTTVKTT